MKLQFTLPYWKLTFLLFAIIGSLDTFGQYPTSDSIENLKKYPLFKAEYMNDHHIKSAVTEVMYKVPMRPIENSLEKESFEFKPNGTINEYRKINSLGDTSHFKYILSQNGNIDKIQFKNKSREILISYTYDERNNITEIHETDVKTDVKIGVEKFKFIYESYNQYKKYWINNEGLTFRYAIISLDNKNRVTKDEGRYIRGTNKHSYAYFYTDGLLTEFISNIRETTRKEVKYEMEYSIKGDLLNLNQYQDGAHLFQCEYLYENGLLIAILEKNVQTKRIKITKIKYSFY